jgi:hypothetical protein
MQGKTDESQEIVPAEVAPPEPPRIVITFGQGPNDVRISVTGCSPYSMWGAARMLEQYAEDSWQAAQMQQAMAQAAAQQAAQPQDHKSKRKGAN